MKQKKLQSKRQNETKTTVYLNLADRAKSLLRGKFVCNFI